MQINHYDPDVLIHGLLDGDTFTNRVAGRCLYRCPHCGHGIRFRWRDFYKADERSFLKRQIRGMFDTLMADGADEESGFLDFHCLTCRAPTRIIFAIYDYTEIAFHFDIRSVYVGERETEQ